MTHRFTLDHAEDHGLVAAVYEALWRPDRPVFPLADILTLLDERPGLRETNARYAGVNRYRHHVADPRAVPAAARLCPGEARA
jgi:spore coat polysaccharide biosynthesis protein SpsF